MAVSECGKGQEGCERESVVRGSRVKFCGSCYVRTEHSI